MKTLIALLLGLICVATLRAETAGKPDPIDVELQKQIDKDPSTAGMVQATADAEKKWDHEMNLAYQKLKKVMGKQEWAALEVSQKAWLAFRDKEFATQTEIFNRMEGSMWRPVSVNERMELVKSRALVLRGYLSTISERD